MTDVATTDEKDLRRKAYSAATTRLRNDFRADFDRLVQEEMQARGVDWQPRLSEEEKAARTVEELLAAHPGIRARFA